MNRPEPPGMARWHPYWAMDRTHLQLPSSRLQRHRLIKVTADPRDRPRPLDDLNRKRAKLACSRPVPVLAEHAFSEVEALLQRLRYRSPAEQFAIALLITSDISERMSGKFLQTDQVHLNCLMWSNGAVRPLENGTHEKWFPAPGRRDIGRKQHRGACQVCSPIRVVCLGNVKHEMRAPVSPTESPRFPAFDIM